MPAPRRRRAMGARNRGSATRLQAASTQYWSIADNASLSLSGDPDVTIAAWVKMSSKPGEAAVVSKNTNASNDELLIEYYGIPDRFVFACATESVQSSNFGSTPLDTWLFLCAQRDSTNNLLYISVNAGTANSAAHASTPSDTANAFQVGRYGTIMPFDGLIDGVLIWKSAAGGGALLTGAQISALYNNGNGLAQASARLVAPTVLVGSWGFDGNGLDTSGNGNHLTPANNPTFVPGKT